MIAVCRIRPQPDYRRDAFEKGLRATGYRLVENAMPAGPKDLLVIWNRYDAMHRQATDWEARGGTVLVCENGYIGADPEGRQYYAISAHGHNGSGWWPVGTEDRWAALGIPLRPWTALAGANPSAGGYALVCGQRGIGSPEMASPDHWHQTAAAYVSKWHPNVRIRLHPGRHAPTVPLERDLEGASYCVIWSSSSGVKALTLGVPVIYDAPHWICQGAASAMRQSFEDPTDEERLAALRRMAWAQWSVAEIEAGEPFARFLSEIAVRRAA